MTVLCLDVGKRRIGLAGTDPTDTLVLPLQVLERSSPRRDLDQLLDVIDDRSVTLVVVGIPLREDGSEGRIAKDARFLATKLLQLRDGLDVEFQDEAYSTVEADERLMERGMDARQRREVVDAVAAQVILESWKARQAPPG